MRQPSQCFRSSIGDWASTNSQVLKIWQLINDGPDAFIAYYTLIQEKLSGFVRQTEFGQMLVAYRLIDGDGTRLLLSDLLDCKSHYVG
jgi:hypothetical protein